MIEIDPTRWKQPPPFKHQLEGCRALVKHPAFYLADKPRTMKSRQVIDAACILFEAKLVDIVVIIAPVPGRGVWGDKQMGQIKRWAWKPSRVHEFHEKRRDLWADEKPELLWVVTNYDFIRSVKRLEEFTKHLAHYDKIMLVLDESSAVGNEKSKQAKAVRKIRDMAARCVMLNGTPGDPVKQWSQFNILNHVFDKKYKSLITFKWRFTKYGPKELRQKFVPTKDGQKLVWQKAVSSELGWKNLDALSRITAPYCLRRSRRDCEGVRDIAIVPSFKEVRLSNYTWNNYKELREEALLALSTGEIYVSPNIGVRLMRLAQICSGHLGGFEEGEKVRDLSSEKIDFTVYHLREEISSQCVVVWTRWTRERERISSLLRLGGFEVHQIYGQQPDGERRIAEKIFSEGSTLYPLQRYAIVAQPQAGGDCLDMSAARYVVRQSCDYNPRTFEQSNERPCGPAQKLNFVPMTNMVACGPAGQRTIEHTILAAQEEKRDIERMTCKEWRTELEAEC